VINVAQGLGHGDTERVLQMPYHRFLAAGVEVARRAQERAQALKDEADRTRLARRLGRE
jgi:hypothetical protein